MDKKALRHTILTHRRALSPEEVRLRSARIGNRLSTLAEFSGAQTLLIYVASKDNEVDTIPIIQTALSGEVGILIPIARRNGLMEWSRLQALDELAPSRFGILEPRPETCRIMTPPPDAVVIVPGIAFTPTGQRIGYGGGYYDRFLATHHGPSIALAFDVQLTATFDTEPHDTPVDFLITESQLFRCRDQRTGMV